MNKNSAFASASEHFDDIDKFVRHIRAEAHAAAVRHSAVLAGYVAGDSASFKVLVSSFIGMELLNGDVSSGVVSQVIRYICSLKDEDIQHTHITIINGSVLTIFNFSDQQGVMLAYDMETLKPVDSMPPTVFHSTTYYLSPVVDVVNGFIGEKHDKTE